MTDTPVDPSRWLTPWHTWQPAADGPADSLRAGLRDYGEHVADRLRPTLAGLAGGQQPDVLFITCADSRVVPNLITSSGPGDLFVVRNVGNLVPTTGPDASVTAAVDFAVDVLGVRTVAVCGHSTCGAMTALLSASPDGPLATWLHNGQDSLQAWRSGHPVARAARAAGDPETAQLAKTNVAVQLERLAAYPTVARAAAGRGLALEGLFLDIPSAACSELTADGSFAAVG